MIYRILHVLLRGIWKALYRMRVSGRENVPRGRAILCAVHTALSDPVILAIALKAEDHPRFMAKKELFSFGPFRWLISSLGAFPVDRDKPDLRAIKTALEILRGGRKLMVLPHGHRQKEDREATEVKNGAAMLAARAGAPLVPVYISRGRRPFLDKITVVFGEPVSFPPENRKPSAEDYQQIMERVMDDIERLCPA